MAPRSSGRSRRGRFAAAKRSRTPRFASFRRRFQRQEHLRAVYGTTPLPVSTVGVWPTWPETLAVARRRFAERLLVYISRGVKARRNFVLVSHADCVASCLALMPHGRVVEAVGYGATMLAWRTPLPALLTSPRTTAKRLPEASCLRRSPSGQRCWWDGEDDGEQLATLCRTAWQIETSDVTLGCLDLFLKTFETCEASVVWPRSRHQLCQVRATQQRGLGEGGGSSLGAAVP